MNYLYSPSGVALSTGSLVMVEGAPAGLTITATYGGHTKIGRFVPADPASVTNAPDRYAIDVSGFAADGATTPQVLIALSGTQGTWTFTTTPNNGVGQIIPFSSFVPGVPWTRGEKVALGVAGAAAVALAAWALWPDGKQQNPRRRR